VDKKALIFTATEGHLSLGQAVDQILQNNGWQTQVFDLFDKKYLTRTAAGIYKSIYKYFPALFSIHFTIGRQKDLMVKVRTFLKDYFKKDVANIIKQYEPDVILTTHFSYGPAIVDLQFNIPFLQIVHDTLTIHPLSVEPQADKLLVYDSRTANACKQLGVNRKKIVINGWFIRQQFWQKCDVAKVRQKLNFNSKIFTILVCGGSDGNNSVLNIVPAFLTNGQQLQVIVVCGKNRMLYKGFQIFLKTQKKLFRKNLKMKLIQFTNQMADYIKVSDLVIGKAGPNLLFETIACGKPFLAVGHIHGQEDGNLKIIKNKKLGYVQENPILASRLLQKIIKNQRGLNKFKVSIKKERRYLAYTPEIFLKTLNCLSRSATTSSSAAATG
jgi:UDP-N-acetylglucosamine:LPS N-acetylglucosamine transferase